MIGVLGCGNMASAIVQGYFQKDNNVQFITYDPNQDNAKKLAESVKGEVAENIDRLKKADSLVLACKPQHFNDLSQSLRDSGIDLASKHFISILAATPIEVIQKKLGAKRVTRIMPNTPAFVGKGMTLVMHSDDVEAGEKDLVQAFFSACGEVAEMPDETTFDQVTTVSGSGPAYVFLFAKTMADKLQSWGVSEEQAKKIAIQLFRGSSELMHAQSDISFQELIDRVTSKGGVTIEAVKSYQADHIGQLTDKALDAAYARSVEMTKEVNQ
ncbi:MAG: pyrroline-5-carboxylate reductase [Halobacteriovoraceae bacterium]|nr:pyrroline-5-carboxylate reductase [Halobacteriovoraceae bacterium]|tara:strand:- start:3950 stop:4759 length:810 start_codon:yes stop_codon:yes gene_type:complete